MPQLEISYRAQGATLERFHLSTKSVQGIMGPLGSGKTNATAYKIFDRICEQPADANDIRRSRWIVTRNTYPDLMDTTIRDWREIVPDECGRFMYGHPPEHRLSFRLPDKTKVESEVLFLALDRPEHVKKLRGIQATGGWMNEAKEQPKAVLDMLTLRVGRYPRAADLADYWSGVLMDYNAPDEDHWLYTLEEQWRNGELPDFEFFIQPGAVQKVGDKWVVNPEAENLQNLKAGYYERGLQGKGEDWIKVNLGNQYGFVVDGKPVHADYVDSVHCWPEVLRPTPGIPIRVGLDFGLSPAAAFAQQQPNGRWHVLDEIVCEDEDTEELARQLHSKVSEYEGYQFVFRGDPSGDIRAQTDSETPFRILRANNIPATAASSNDAELRRAAIDRPLTRLVQGKPGLIVSPKCKVLRKGLAGGFCYKRVQVATDERYRNEPDKNQYSHVVEALEYALMDAGEKATVPKASGRPIVIHYEEPCA